ncbi:MAG: DNA-binding response regulator [Flavobacteriales bacterium]|nr:MAG: DNA-binding response regulator [Flavobacteriales bacterium]
MNKIKAIIVDDEKRARNVLDQLLSRNFDNIEVVAQCADVPSAVEEIKRLKPDVVFLDIQMPNYVGYELVNFFDKVDFDIIFVTAFDQYAIKAFELSAIDYIVKPIDRNKLTQAVEKLALKLKQENKLKDYEVLFETMKSNEFKKIIIPELGNRRIVNLDEIIAIEAHGAYAKIYLLNNKPITMSKNLKHFERLLGNSLGFFRSHRAWIVNLNHIESVNKADLCLTLPNGLKAKIARGQYDAFELAIR